MDKRNFIETDFTEDELELLRMIFSGAEAVIQAIQNNIWASNLLCDLKEKLGIYDLLR
jgi:hypothetical protein